MCNFCCIRCFASEIGFRILSYNLMLAVLIVVHIFQGTHCYGKDSYGDHFFRVGTVAFATLDTSLVRIQCSFETCFLFDISSATLVLRKIDFDAFYTWERFLLKITLRLVSDLQRESIVSAFPCS